MATVGPSALGAAVPYTGLARRIFLEREFHKWDVSRGVTSSRRQGHSEKVFLRWLQIRNEKWEKNGICFLCRSASSRVENSWRCFGGTESGMRRVCLVEGHHRGIKPLKLPSKVAIPPPPPRTDLPLPPENQS